MTRKLVLVVIDGLTPTMLEASLGTAGVPTLTALAEHGTLGRATSTFPSLTPVCLSSIATGAHPDVHEIPHLVWWHRGERRLVEYGSSFGAARAAGLGRTLRDTLVGMNAEHLGRGAVTMFEALADAGIRTAAVNFTAYRGRTRHRPAVPFLGPVLGPERFYFYNLFRSERTGAPLSFRNRPAGSIDSYAAAVGRWLVTRDGFDFLLLYLSDYDYASHAAGPDTAHVVLERCDDAIGGLVRAAGGLDEFLERYAVIVVSDHGQTSVSRGRAARRQAAARARDACRGVEPRGARLPDRCGRAVGADARGRLDGEPSVEVALFHEDGALVARRDGAELRLDGDGSIDGDAAILDHPDAVVARDRSASMPERRGRGRVGDGGLGVRGSRAPPPPRRRLSRLLVAGDSLVPVLMHGVAGPAPTGIVDVAPTVLAHFGVAAPAYAMRRAA